MAQVTLLADIKMAPIAGLRTMPMGITPQSHNTLYFWVAWVGFGEGEGEGIQIKKMLPLWQR